MIKKMRCHVAVSGREVGNRMSPIRWVRGLRSDIVGDRFSGKSPDFNPGLVPCMSKYTTTSIIERLAVALRTIVQKSTAVVTEIDFYVAALTRIMKHRAINSSALNRTLDSLRYGATSTSMEGHMICRTIVDTFEDVDLP